MDIKQNYREETNLEPYAGDDERHPIYSNNYVRWLEQQLILHGVVVNEADIDLDMVVKVPHKSLGTFKLIKKRK